MHSLSAGRAARRFPAPCPQSWLRGAGCTTRQLAGQPDAAAGVAGIARTPAQAQAGQGPLVLPGRMISGCRLPMTNVRRLRSASRPSTSAVPAEQGGCLMGGWVGQGGCRRRMASAEPDEGRAGGRSRAGSSSVMAGTRAPGTLCIPMPLCPWGAGAQGGSMHGLPSKRRDSGWPKASAGPSHLQAPAACTTQHAQHILRHATTFRSAWKARSQPYLPQPAPCAA